MDSGGLWPRRTQVEQLEECSQKHVGKGGPGRERLGQTGQWAAPSELAEHHRGLEISRLQPFTKGDEEVHDLADLGQI